MAPMSTITRLSSLLGLTLLAACGGGGAHFDYVAVFGYEVVKGNTGDIVTENKRAYDASLQGSEGADPLMSSATAALIKPDPSTHAALLPVATADHSLFAVQVGGKIELISTADGTTRATAPLADNEQTIAVDDGGGRLAVLTDILSGSPHLQLAQVPSGALSDCGAVVTAATPAVFSGGALYAVDDEAFVRVSGDCTRTPIDTAGRRVTRIVAEPRGTRVWGVLDHVTAFHVDGGGTTITTLDSITNRVGDQLTVGVGGRLAFVDQGLYVTGEDGASPRPVPLYGSVVDLVTLALSPDGSALAFGDPGGGTGENVGWAKSDASSKDDAATVLTQQGLPLAVWALY